MNNWKYRVIPLAILALIAWILNVPYVNEHISFCCGAILMDFLILGIKKEEEFDKKESLNH